MAKPWRETPLIESVSLSNAAGCKVYMKLDNLQPSGSFKSRGIGNYLVTHLAKSKHASPSGTNGANTPLSEGSNGHSSAPTHFYCSSGGNAGLACATAATQLNCLCTVVVPQSTKQMMIDKIRAAGASEVIIHGTSWQEADTFLREELLDKDAGGVYVPPFDHPDIWTGHATLIDELRKQLAEISLGASRPDSIGDLSPSQPSLERLMSEPPDAVICSVGGGGLLNGIVQGKTCNAMNSDCSSSGWYFMPVIAVETRGADSLAASLEAGELTTLPAITSAATSLGARRVCEQTLAYASDSKMNVFSLVLTDADAARACVRFADEERMMVELACGVAIAVLYDESRRLEQILSQCGRWKGSETKVVLEVCGGSVITSGMLEKWRSEMVKQ